MIFWIAAILLIAAVALFVAAPLADYAFSGIIPANQAESELREHEHTLAVQGLRELEFDHAMGKLDAGDYQTLRQRLVNRALASMDREKTFRQLSADPPDLKGDASPPTVAAHSRIMNFCPQCGTKIAQPHNFCPDCGAVVAGIAIL